MQLQEQILSPFVILRIARRDFSTPVIAKAQSTQLPPEIIYCAAGGNGRMDPSFQSVLFGRQTEGVPAHGMQYVETRGALIASEDIGGSISSMSYVQTPYYWDRETYLRRST